MSVLNIHKNAIKMYKEHQRNDEHGIQDDILGEVWRRNIGGGKHMVRYKFKNSGM